MPPTRLGGEAPSAGASSAARAATNDLRGALAPREHCARFAQFDDPPQRPRSQGGPRGPRGTEGGGAVAGAIDQRAA
eukprot:4963750-Pyramimonas_sp.AAC.1